MSTCAGTTQEAIEHRQNTDMIEKQTSHDREREVAAWLQHPPTM